MTKKRVLRFLSRNPNKLREAQQILGPAGFELIGIDHGIEELQSDDPKRIVRDKILKAYSYSGRPLIVEHTGLYLDALNGFPGGLTQVFWNAVGPDRFAALFGSGPTTRVTARTYVGYTDGTAIHIVQGEISGRVPSEPRGSRDFQWDCVFVPDGHELTFAELGEDKKNEISMRRLALNAFVELVQSQS